MHFTHKIANFTLGVPVLHPVLPHEPPRGSLKSTWLRSPAAPWKTSYLEQQVKTQLMRASTINFMALVPFGKKMSLKINYVTRFLASFCLYSWKLFFYLSLSFYVLLQRGFYITYLLFMSPKIVSKLQIITISLYLQWMSLRECKDCCASQCLVLFACHHFLNHFICLFCFHLTQGLSGNENSLFKFGPPLKCYL